MYLKTRIIHVHLPKNIIIIIHDQTISYILTKVNNLFYIK